MDADQTIRLRHMLSAVEQLSALLGSGERMVDGDGCPLPGSVLARVHMILSMGYPEHAPRKPGRN